MYVTCMYLKVNGHNNETWGKSSTLPPPYSYYWDRGGIQTQIPFLSNSNSEKLGINWTPHATVCMITAFVVKILKPCACSFP